MEILHKAKRLDTGQWIEGYYCKTGIERDLEPSDVFFVPFNINSKEKWGWIKVNPETICRYIGKNDNNGNKIWEHDIISINTYDYMEPAEDFFGEVVYCEAWACWCIKQPGEEKPIPLCECEGSYKTDICVIGNSIDNPELLERTDL